MRIRRNILSLVCLVALALLGASCSEEDSTWDPYKNWKARNAEWYLQITDSARTAIAQAKAQWGDDWENHCEWRRYKSLWQDAAYDTGDYRDSVCVHIYKKGTRDVPSAISPYSNDSVRVHFRGWIMPTQFAAGDGTFNEEQKIFTQTYFGNFDEATAAPSLMPMTGLTAGFGTALQYMVPGDDWFIYVPQKLGYGEETKTGIPAYSTLLFRLNLVAVYRAGSGVPDWK